MSKVLLTEVGNIVQLSSVVQSYLTLCNPMGCSMPGFPVLYQLPELAQTHVHSVSDGIRPSISSSVVPFSTRIQLFPAIGSFLINQFFASCGQNMELQLIISPSNEYSEWIFFTIDWLDILAVQGTIKSLLQHHSSKASWRSDFFMVQLSIHT